MLLLEQCDSGGADTSQVQPKPFKFDLKLRPARQEALEMQYDAVWAAGKERKSTT